MRKNRFVLLTGLLVLWSQLLLAQNPIIKDIGMSDPHVRIFNDTIYLFTGHDQTLQDKIWDMRYWQVFSSTDLINWKMETIISPKNNYMEDDSKDCWAGDAVKRNGKYYFYFSDRNRSVGVMEAEQPGGEYFDPLGHALIEPGHDPTVFVDDDAAHTPYLVYGSNEIGGFHVVKLNDDMVSLAEKPKHIVINGDTWANAPEWQDKNYIFKHRDTYYLSWGRDYAISKNIYGPYESVGAVGNGYKLSEFAHGSFFWWKGQFYHIWCYYIVDGLKYRESIITYCHFDKEGKIVTDTRFLDKHFENGVGQYNACWDRIEAEWYYEKSKGLEKAQRESGDFYLTNFQDGNWIKYSKVTFEGNENCFEVKASSIGGKGVLELRKDSLDGPKLCSLDLAALNESFNTVLNSDKIKVQHGEYDLYLVYKGSGSLELDWLRFLKK